MMSRGLRRACVLGKHRRGFATGAADNVSALRSAERTPRSPRRSTGKGLPRSQRQVLEQLPARNRAQREAPTWPCPPSMRSLRDPCRPGVGYQGSRVGIGCGESGVGSRVSSVGCRVSGLRLSRASHAIGRGGAKAAWASATSYTAGHFSSLSTSLAAGARRFHRTGAPPLAPRPASPATHLDRRLTPPARGRAGGTPRARPRTRAPPSRR